MEPLGLEWKTIALGASTPPKLLRTYMEAAHFHLRLPPPWQWTDKAGKVYRSRAWKDKIAYLEELRASPAKFNNANAGRPPLTARALKSLIKSLSGFGVTVMVMILVTAVILVSPIDLITMMERQACSMASTIAPVKSIGFAFYDSGLAAPLRTLIAYLYESIGTKHAYTLLQLQDVFLTFHKSPDHVVRAVRAVLYFQLVGMWSSAFVGASIKLATASWTMMNVLYDKAKNIRSLPSELREAARTGFVSMVRVCKAFVAVFLRAITFLLRFSREPRQTWREARFDRNDARYQELRRKWSPLGAFWDPAVELYRSTDFQRVMAGSGLATTQLKELFECYVHRQRSFYRMKGNVNEAAFWNSQVRAISKRGRRRKRVEELSS